MIQLNQIDHINMKVKDFEETINFYQEHFGFELKEEGKSMSGTPYKIIGSPGKLYLCLYNTNYSLDEAPINHIGFHVKNFDETLAYIKKNKIRVTMDTYQYEKSRSIYIEDPNGHEIEISEKFGGGLD